MILRTILDQGSKSPRGTIWRDVFAFDNRHGFFEADMKGLAIVRGTLRKLAPHQVVRKAVQYRLEDKVLALRYPGEK